MKEGIPGKELLGQKIREGPLLLSGVGGLTVTANDEWLTAMDRTDGKLQAMQCITLNKVTADFPRVRIHEAVFEIKKDKPSNKRLQGLRLPKEIGGTDTDILLGIKHLAIFPKEIHSLPCGLTIY